MSESESKTVSKPTATGKNEQLAAIIWGKPYVSREERLAKYNLSQHDIEILRQLAGRLVEIAHSPVNLERKNAWYRHDKIGNSRPMILTEVFDVRDEHAPLPRSIIKCENSWARNIEWQLRLEIYQFDILKDDHVVEPYWNLNWHVHVGDFGVEILQHTGENYGGMAGKSWDPPLKNLDKDLDKLHPFTYSVDRETTMAEKQYLDKVFGDILPVRIRGRCWWSMGLTLDVVLLVGLENLMMDMITNPKGLHRLLAFLRDNYIAYAEWLEKEGLLSLNNENDSFGSGGLVYTHDLPQPGKKPGDPVRMKDLWIFLESQETVGVGPKQFEEIVFPYQLSIAPRFGKCYYGCCEPLHTRVNIIKRLPNLARVSVSPWANQEIMGEALGKELIFSRKPHPLLVSTEHFDEDAIRADIRKTMNAAKGCRLEFIMKDVHTLYNEPNRLARWVEIAREEVAKPL